MSVRELESLDAAIQKRQKDSRTPRRWREIRQSYPLSELKNLCQRGSQ